MNHVTSGGAPSLPSGELHVWSIRLDQPSHAAAAFEDSLSHDEVRRARAFVFARDRIRYVVCRSALRQVLATYLGVSAALLTFRYGPHGKPSLSTFGADAIDFNVSHAAGLAVIAVTRVAPVGVDVEAVTRIVDFEKLATRFFSAAEASELLALPVDARRGAFFNCWTRKEAYVKAIGHGLSCPLDSFAVTLRPHEDAAMRWMEGDAADRWFLRAFTPEDGYVGAVALRGAPRVVRVRRWSMLDEDAGSEERIDMRVGR